MLTTIENLQRASDQVARLVEASRQFSAQTAAEHPEAWHDAARVGLVAVRSTRTELELVHSGLQAAPGPQLEIEATEVALEVARSTQDELVRIARTLARAAFARSLMAPTAVWPKPDVRSRA